ncbi:SusC/RagA family TonB-linked outer membrane protein [Chitinophaga eiseniae]|uniref:SusC/RagA family TonB-linked outer membrane protein n=1 Tax=Chitinophaga eiseniae TaxID=634771 RepID=A0A847SMX1_9BACT|nr:SusC/RagA family TonB-linked outer membrane protein [Chitinophaga eiseniae]NLR79088.1 SusC/RagA family TonB-linked outer membrane protein [Chitinophaga eiseniae]
MKLSVMILLGALLQVQASSLAQTVSFSGRNVPINKVLREVEKQTGYFIFYSSNEIREMTASRMVSVNMKQAPLDVFLKSLFNGQPLYFRLEDKTIFILKDRAPAAVATTENLTPPVTVAGRVTDLEGNPVPGVTIMVQGTRIATTANDQGQFKLEGIPEKAMIVFSAVGYMPTSARYTGNTVVPEPLYVMGRNGQREETEGNTRSTVLLEDGGNLSVKLARMVKGIETVVVTGIFQRNINNFTGASKTISGAEAKKISANNVFAAVAALDPSFRIVPNNVAGGNINQLPEIQMRGQNSFPNLSGQLSNNPNAPLFILDGFEVNLQRIVDLDMNLINSITLLKDASATAIYGSRGANGVMVVTTVTPKAGKMQVTVTNDFRATTPDLSVYNLLNAAEKLDFEKRAGVYSSTSLQLQQKLEALYYERYRAMKSGVNTDWLAIPVQNGYSNRTTLYMQGGDQSIRYGLQLGADLQSGVMKGQNRKNYTGQFDLNYMIKKLQFRNSIRIMANNANESPYGNFSDYVRMNPYWTPYDGTGNVKPLLEDLSYSGTIYRQTNPVYNATLHSVNRAQYFGISNNFSARYALLPSLYFETNFSLNRQSGSSDQFYSAQDGRFANITDVSQKGSYTARNDNSFSYESLTTGNLNISFGPHQVFSTLGFNFANNSNNYYQLVAQGFPYDRLDNLLFAAQYQANSRPTGDESTIRRVGVVYSGNYTYDNRFLADVSLRRDGSSQYGTKKRFGTFWSAGIGWNIHNESFFTQSDVVNRLKIRASYGSTGSLNIPAYSAQNLYTFGVGTAYYNELGAVFSGLGNETLSWQSVYKTNLGADLVLFREKVDARVDVYRENTRNSLTQITLAPSTGFASYSENLGQIQNTGFEFSVRYKIMEKRADGLLWSVNVNGITNRNVLKEISNKLKASNDKLNAGSNQTTPNILLQEGQSTNTIYAVRSLGVDPATGSEVFLSKDGKPTYIWNVADKVPVGIAQPKWNGNFGTNFMFKGFELNMIFSCQFGGQLYNQTLIDRVESVNPGFNVDRRAYDLGWKGPGDVSRYTAIKTDKPVTLLTSRFVQDDNTVNLSSASLGYNFYRSAFVKRIGFRSLQVTAITNDVFRVSSIQIERGTGNPFARTYSLTVRAGL